MATIIKILVALIFSLTLTSTNAQDNYNLTVSINGADNNKGRIMIAVYNESSHFLSKGYKYTTSKLSNKGCEVNFNNLPEGTYAVSVFHDENDNGKLDSNFLGVPKEDYGCSNNAKGFMGPPKWKDAKFQLKANKQITITL